MAMKVIAECLKILSTTTPKITTWISIFFPLTEGIYFKLLSTDSQTSSVAVPHSRKLRVLGTRQHHSSRVQHPPCHSSRNAAFWSANSREHQRPVNSCASPMAAAVTQPHPWKIW